MRYPIPANDADFEAFCLTFLRVHWKCPSLDLYAHRGEEQFGIDILDLGGKEPLCAAQCKLHDPWKPIPPTEIRNEVKKAEKFSPALGFYSILTSAKSSRDAHDEVLKINQEHHKRRLFKVELMTWGKIENLVDQYDEVKQFLGTVSGRTATEIRKSLSAIHEAVVSKSSHEVTRREPPAPIPKADANRFSVALAHLTHDEGQEAERLIVESIRDVVGVQILRFDRTISAEGPVPEESEREAHDMARSLLREASADALIWGTVLSHGGRTAPRLYWTTAESAMRSEQPYLPENFRLPEVFWEDLVEVLRLLLVTRSRGLFARRGWNVVADLTPFVEKVRNLLESDQASKRWTPEAVSEVKFILARALEQLGEQRGERISLSQSVHYYRTILGEGILSRNPAYRFALPNNLGVALGALGTLESDSSHLMAALTVFRDTLNTPTLRERFPLEWASLQNNLGNALLMLGLRESGIEKLRQAEEAYRAALSEWPQERFPLDWAILQMNLGYSLHVAGSRESGNDRLLTSIACLQSALEVCAQGSTPMYWARAQSNLGSALMSLGQRQPGIELLEDAVSAYRLALRERIFEREPLAWGETQNNLGAVLIEITDRMGHPSGLREAVCALRESLKVRTRAAAPMAFATSNNNLGRALIRLGEYENEAGHFQDAIDAFRNVLQMWTRESLPSHWSTAQHNLGDALRGLGYREKSLSRLDEARVAYDQALTGRHQDREPIPWAATHSALGLLHYLKGEIELGTESLEQAVQHYELVLEENRANVDPFARAGVLYYLGNAQRLLGQRKDDSSLVLEALGNHAAACRDRLPFSPYWALRAAAEVVGDVEVLKARFDPTSFELALPKHDWILALHAKHQGHSIGLMPAFRAVVAGTSGSKKPDFSAASKRGDRIIDGTVVWENAGKFSYCKQCGQFLAAPNSG
jgi:tetratricopeptide (TPR) repeat protein